VCDPWTSSISITRELGKKFTLSGFILGLNQELWAGPSNLNLANALSKSLCITEEIITDLSAKNIVSSVSFSTYKS
jgi:hypothetical protein